MSTVLPTQKREYPHSDISSDENSDAKAELKSIPELGAPDTDQPGLHGSWKQAKRDPNAIATQPSVFDDPNTLEAYRPPPEYENTHRFDPNARWTWGEEQRVVRKIDYRIMVWAFIMFFSLDLDRTNISQANADNFLQDLHINTNDFNLGNTLFRLAFLIAELPSQLISKRVGPDIWIPCQMTLWSIVAISQYWLQGRSSFLATRFLLGFLQGGFIPDIVLYLSYFYTKRELTIRLAYFWISNYVSHIVGAFLAVGLLKLRGVNGQAGWRYLFLVEGAFTFLIGIISFALMPAGPTQTRSRIFPKGWFTDRDEVIMVNRVLRDDPTKSSMHNREGLSVHNIWVSLTDWSMWPLYILGIMHFIPVGPPQTYLTLTLRQLGFNTVKTNLLTIPSIVIGGIGLVATAYLSEVINSRVISTVIQQVWSLPLLIALYTFNAHTSRWVYYVVVTLIAGYPYVHPIQVAWASRNSYSVRTRTVSASIYNMFVQAGTIVYSQIYRADDAPLYKRGNRTLIAINVLNILLYAGTYFFYRGINARRDKIWNSWTAKEREEYISTTTDKGNKRMDFRYAY